MLEIVERKGDIPDLLRAARAAFRPAQDDPAETEDDIHPLTDASEGPKP